MNFEGRSAPDAYGVDELAEYRALLRKADPNLTEAQLDTLVGFLRGMLKETDRLLVSTLEHLSVVLERKADEDLTGVLAPGLKRAAQIARARRRSCTDGRRVAARRRSRPRGG